MVFKNDKSKFNNFVRMLRDATREPTKEQKQEFENKFSIKAIKNKGKARELQADNMLRVETTNQGRLGEIKEITEPDNKDDFHTEIFSHQSLISKIEINTLLAIQNYGAGL